MKRLYRALLLLCAPILFFSYHPLLSLGASSSMNFELSLPLLWLVLFDLVSVAALLSLWRARPPRGATRTSWGINFPGISDKKIFRLTLFPFFATLSVFWSANPLRGLLTAGVLWLVFFAAFSILYLAPVYLPDVRSLKPKALKIFFAAALFVCAFCFLQSILDLCGLSRETTLLCAGCTYRSFGFPHPSGFAIEPQFMGNLLLAPALLSLYLLCFQSPSSDSTLQKKRQLALAILSFIFSLTLFFTFSRGAIYAFAVALLVLLIFHLHKTAKTQPQNASKSATSPKSAKPAAPLLVIPLAAFLTSLALQGTFAALGPTSETFTSAVTKSIHQLSLSLIDLRPQKALEPAPTTLATPAPSTPENATPETPAAPAASETQNEPETPIFSGYVAESTDVRLGLSHAALDTWLSAPNHPASGLTVGLKCGCGDVCCAAGPLTPTSILFGVGLGGAGTALYLNSFITGITTPKEIVQNEPLSLLLELGLVGTLLALYSLYLLLLAGHWPKKSSSAPSSADRQGTFASSFLSSPALPLLVALLLAYFISLQFFSGLPNALHIYLLPPLFFLIFSQNPKKSS